MKILIETNGLDIEGNSGGSPVSFHTDDMESGVVRIKQGDAEIVVEFEALWKRSRLCDDSYSLEIRSAARG